MYLKLFNMMIYTNISTKFKLCLGIMNLLQIYKLILHQSQVFKCYKTKFKIAKIQE